MKGLLPFVLLAVMALSRVCSADANSALTAPRNATIKVAFVLSEGAMVIDFAGPWEVFQDTESSTPFELYTVAPSKAPIHTSGSRHQGMTVTPDNNFADAPEPASTRT